MTFLITIIVLVLIFDFINGFHDSANSIATVVSTQVLTPLQAVLFAAFFNSIAGFVFSLKVATTIGKGIVEPDVIAGADGLVIIASGLVGAIIWNLITWWKGLPSSSSHTLVGGFAGAAITGAGFQAVIMSGITKILVFILIAPLMGMAISILISAIVINIFKNYSPSKVDKNFRRLQLLSAGAFSLGHGGNDAQKSMGIIIVALIVTGHLTKTDVDAGNIPSWIIISCYMAIGLGTLFGGWRIVKTMGQKITKLNPFEGFCAETSGALTLFAASGWGIPVSTTHTITGAIIGVGARKSISAVRWGVAKDIVWAWILTIPISAAISAGVYLIVKAIL